MHGRWRLFRHAAGREAGPPAVAYVALFALCLLVGQWSVDAYKAVIVWPANGVLLAAFLQLPRRKAFAVLLLCLGLNLGSTVMRGDGPPYVWLNPLLNLTQVLIAGVLARRLCGAALDLRRPRRLLTFALGAAVPAVLVTSTASVLLAVWVRGYSPELAVFVWTHLVMMETLGLLVVTPSLLFLARAHRFRGETASPWLSLSLLALTAAVVSAVFLQSGSLLFLIFPPLMLAAYLLSPPWMAATLLAAAGVSCILTLEGHGPVAAAQVSEVTALAHVPGRLRQMSLYHGFLLVAVLCSLPLSALMAERRAAAKRLAQRTALALAQRRRAEAAAAAKARFLALMSHEMRTPLNGVSGYADLLSRRADLTDEARAQVVAVRDAGEAMLRLVEDVLDASDDDAAVRSEIFPVAAFVREAGESAAMAAEAKGLAFDLDLDVDEAVRGRGDPHRLAAALRHLLSNAVKFTDQGRVALEARLDGGRLTLTVRDMGPGIAPELEPVLFDLFQLGDDSLNRRHGGAGLGLPAARRHARAMGGDVILSRTSTQGSVFTLTAQLDLSAIETDVESPGGLTDAASSLRVLVVDDHPTNRLMLRTMMEAAGCAVAEAVDGRDAVGRAALEIFDLILMDVRMPRLNGLEATQMIRDGGAASAQAVVLAVTADAMPEDAARCLGVGMDGHLAKPVTHDRLYAAVDQAFRAAQARLAA